MARYNRSSDDFEGLMYAVIFGIAIVFGLIAASRWILVHDTQIVTVTEKGERCKNRDDCKYLIYTDKGTFENTDSLLNWKWNSSDVYGAIKIGHQYEFKTNGSRVGFLSWYPNINSVREIQ